MCNFFTGYLCILLYIVVKLDLDAIKKQNCSIFLVVVFLLFYFHYLSSVEMKLSQLKQSKYFIV